MEDTIAFEQNDFLRQIANGWDVSGARVWFENLQEADEKSSSGLWLLAHAITDAVVFYQDNLPPTLALDYSHIRILQLDFQTLVYQAACQQTLNKMLELLGWTGKASPRSYAELFVRVAPLILEQGLQFDYWQVKGSVVLEIVRAAYAICSNREPPTSEDLEFAEDFLSRCCDSKQSEFVDTRDSLAAVLKIRVYDEMCAIVDLAPAQLMGRQIPQKPGAAVESENEGLLRIARRISHISQLHWRVWGPILYEQRMPVRGKMLDTAHTR